MVQLDDRVVKKYRKEGFNEMRALNIGVHVHYIPVYWHPYYQGLGYEKVICPVAEQWYERALTLPIFPGMNEEDVNYVVNALEYVVN